MQCGDAIANDRVGRRPVRARTFDNEVGASRTLRVPNVGSEMVVGFGLGFGDDATRGLGEARRFIVANERSLASVVRATSQPIPTSPTTLPTGTRASVRKTSLKEEWRFICRIGRASTPGWCIGSTR